MFITLQYLDQSPELEQLTPSAAVERLRRAVDLLPIDALLLGWKLPEGIFESIQAECQRLGITLYRWHPLLTSDGVLQPQPEWRVHGLNGEMVPGFRNLPEFTFVCPNNPGVVEAIQQRVQEALAPGAYQGLFLDRIRFPSPAPDPLTHLACFCPHCQALAAQEGLDLLAARREIAALGATAAGRAGLLLALIGRREPRLSEPAWEALHGCLNFRERSVTRFVSLISQQARDLSLQVGLDAFSPGLTRMVGQDLTALSPTAGWIKVMSYAHSLGPASLPFELEALARFLMRDGALTEQAALQALFQALELPAPQSLEAMRTVGLSTGALVGEIEKGVRASKTSLLVGIELVEVPQVARLNREQIERDARAALAAGPDGFSISWDLLLIPLERLGWVRRIWRAEN